MKKYVWINYDLGLRGDYEGLYRWLDSKNAKECAGNTALIVTTVNDDLINELSNSIRENVKIDENKDRIYLIWLSNDDIPKIKGKFIVGNRKRSPWEGYATDVFEAEDVEN